MKNKLLLWGVLGIGCAMLLGGAVWLAAPSMDFDRPQFNEDEVVALVKRDLIGQGLSSHTIASSNDYSAIRYLGDGKWRGTGYVYSIL